MPTHDAGIQSVWECDWVKLPDNDLNRETFQLAPLFLFGHRVDVIKQEDAPDVLANPKDTGEQAPGAPRRASITVITSKKVFAAMTLIQRGAESLGDDPSVWTFVEGSAVELETGRTLNEGETFSILAD